MRRRGTRILVSTLVAVLMITIIGMLISSVSAETSYSPMGLSETMGYSYYNDLYYTSFDNTDMLEKTRTVGGCFREASSVLWIDADTDTGTAYATTGFTGTDDYAYGTMGSYVFVTQFMPMSSDYDDVFWIFSGIEVGLYLHEGLELHLAFVEETNPFEWTEMQYNETIITTLQKDSYYSIWVWVWFEDDEENPQRRVEIYVDCILEETIYYDWQNHGWGNDHIVFGDNREDSGDGRGEGKWNFFRLRGHSFARFFDNFNDGNPYNWRNINRDPYQGINSPTWTVNSADNLYLKSTSTGGGGTVPLCNGQSPYIDYDPDGSYRISFDFKATNTLDSYVVMSNGEFMFAYDSGELNLIYGGDYSNKWGICQLETNEWNFIEISRTVDDIDPDVVWLSIDVNHEQEGLWTYSGYFYDFGNGEYYLKLGDFDSTEQEIHGAYWDNIQLLHWADVLSSGFSSVFHNNPYTQIFIEDFEEYESLGEVDVYDMKEYGWIREPFSNGGDDSHAAWEIGADQQFGSHSGDNIMVTVLNSDYVGQKEGRFITPPINMTQVDEGTMTFYTYIDTDTEDGLRIEYRVENPGGWGAWTAFGLGLQPPFYNSDDVLAFNNGEAFSGGPCDWMKRTLLLNHGNCCGEVVQICFHFKSMQGNQDKGIGIDDLKIFGKSTFTTNDDFDDDGLKNWREYYTFQSSLFETDTDKDHISDFSEVSDKVYNSFDPYTVFTAPAEIGKRDIFIEIDSMVDDEDIPILDEPMKAGFRMVADAFENHNINLHLCYDQIYPEIGEHIPYQYSVGPSQLDEIRDGDFQDEHQYKYYYFVMCYEVVDYGSSSTKGITWEGISTCCFALNGRRMSGQGSDSVGKTFMHELGHSLGMNCYSLSWDWQPTDPGNSSMVSGASNPWIWYVGEKSDQTLSNEHYPMGRSWGGWQYTMNYNLSPTEYWNTLFFKSIEYWDDELCPPD